MFGLHLNFWLTFKLQTESIGWAED